MKQKYLTIPIHIYEGNVEIKGETKVNPLHRFILEIAVKDNKLESIINSFNLDRRLVQEAIIDLMYKEFIYVDLENSLIYVAPEIQNYIDRGRLEEYLEEEYPEIITLKWVQDAVSGQIMMFDDVHDYFRIPLDLKKEEFDPKKKVQLNRRDYIKIQDITPQTLIKVAKMTLRNFIHEGDIFYRVNRIYDLRPIDNRIIYIPLKERTLHGKKFEVPISNTISSTVLEFWTKFLTEIDAYAINDLSPADEEFLIQYDWNLLMKKWNRILTQIGNIFDKKLNKRERKGSLQRINQILKYEVLNKIIPLMVDLSARVGEVEVNLSKGEDILKRLQSITDKASHLMIIGSAFVSHAGIETIYQILESLTSRGVKVILLWGSLGEPLANLTLNYPIFQNENISFIQSNTPFHSKFVVIDNTHVWITSCNLLSYLYNDSSPEEAICELKNGRITNEVLEYARSKLGYKREELNWIDYFSKINLEKDQIIIDKETQLKDTREIIEELMDKCQTLLEHPFDDSLLFDLRETFEKVKNILKKLRRIDTVHLIENLEHRRLLRATLHQAKSTIQIGTDRINRQAVGAVIIAALNDAFNRGVTVQVRWGREDPAKIPKEEQINFLKIIDELRQETSNKIEILDKPSHSHAKFLTMDDNLLLITSFNLFAFAGNGLADDDITDELGIIISSRKQAIKIINTFPEPQPLPKLNYNSKKKPGKIRKY